MVAMPTPVVVVRFRRAPAELLQQARVHLEEITREFQLIEFSDEEVDSPPARLLDVISRLRANYDQLGFAGNRRFALEDRHVPGLDGAVEPRRGHDAPFAHHPGKPREMASRRGGQFLVPKIECRAMLKERLGQKP